VIDGLPDGYTATAASLGDVPAIHALLRARDVVEVGEPETSAAVVEETLRDPRVVASTDTVVVRDRAGAVAAYGELTHSDDVERVNVWIQVHPEHGGRGVGAALLGWAERRATTTPAAVIHQHVDGGDARGRELLEAHGYREVRTHVHLTGSVGELTVAPPPEGVAIHAMRPGEEAAAHDVLAEAFAEHFGITVEPFATWWSVWEADPRFDRDLFLLAVAEGDGAVGVACDFVDDGVGWIGDLAVRAVWRGRGIGRALLGASFTAFRGRGIATARLNADAGNETGAIHLYTSVGMRERRTFLVFEKPREAAG
jgi:ribosomal protein S18 acetylase RimI-like enzyme